MIRAVTPAMSGCGGACAAWMGAGVDASRGQQRLTEDQNGDGEKRRMIAPYSYHSSASPADRIARMCAP